MATASIARRLALLAVAVCLSSCATTTVVRGYVPIAYPNEATLRLEVSPGNEVQLTTGDGRHFIGRVTGVDDAGIAGVFHEPGGEQAERRIPYADIRTFEVLRAEREVRQHEGLEALGDVLQGLMLAAQAFVYIAILAFVLSA